MADTMEWSVVSVFVVVFITCLFLSKVLMPRFKKVYPRGPWGLPVVGHLPFMDKYAEKTFQKWRMVYGDIFRIRMGSWNTIVLNGYDVIKAASEFDNDVFSDRLNFLSFNVQVDANRGIHTVTTCGFNETFIQSKKTTAMALRHMTRKSNAIFTAIVSTTADAFCDDIISKGRSGPTSVDADVHRAFGRILYNVIYGRGQNQENVDKRIEVLLEMLKAFADFSNNPADIMPWMKYLIPAKVSELKKTLEAYRDFDDEELLAHKETFDKDKIQDVADYLIQYELRQKETKDTEQDPVCQVLYNNIKDLYDAGTGTSSCVLLWLILYIVAYPDIQQKIQAEIDDIVGVERNVELDDAEALHYTTAVIHEVLRISSCVPFALPHRAKRNTNFMGFDVDEGTCVLFNIHSIHHETKYWGDPENFRPGRFLDANGRLDKSKCNRVVPFSLGRRRCVGEGLARIQILALFARLMQRCELVKPENDVIDFSPQPGILYFPKPYRVVVRERSHVA